MHYISTRGAAPRLGFEEAMLAGLARDGGLYLPETWPQFSADEIAALAGLPYEEVAVRIMRPYLGDAFGEDEFRAITARAYAGFGHAARCPLRQIGPNDWLMELFHGPTLAFKGDQIDRALEQVIQDAIDKKIRLVEIIPGKGSGALKKKVLRYLDRKDVRARYHRIEKDSDNWGRLFVHFRF